MLDGCLLHVDVLLLLSVRKLLLGVGKQTIVGLDGSLEGDLLVIDALRLLLHDDGWDVGVEIELWFIGFGFLTHVLLWVWMFIIR